MITITEKDEDMLDFLYFLGVDFCIEKDTHNEYHLALESQ